MGTTEAHLFVLAFRPTKPCTMDSHQRIKALLKMAKRMGRQCIRMRLIAPDDLDETDKAGPLAKNDRATHG